MTTIFEQTSSLDGWTEQQLESLPHLGKVELKSGKVIMSPANFDHGFIASIILSRLLTHVLDHHLGVVVDSSTGFRLANEDLLSPDVSFVSAVRLASLPQPLRRFFRGAPDLAVEVLSPSDLRKAAQEKIDAYFANGTRLAWIVDPSMRKVEVRRLDGSRLELAEHEAISGEDVVPGFVMKVAEIFRPYVIR